MAKLAPPLQIGQAVQIRNKYPLAQFPLGTIEYEVRAEANKLIHSQDQGVINEYTIDNYAPSPLAQWFIALHLPQVADQ